MNRLVIALVVIVVLLLLTVGMVAAAKSRQLPAGVKEGDVKSQQLPAGVKEGDVIRCGNPGHPLDGAIFKIENGKRRRYINMVAYSAAGAPPPIHIDCDAIQNIPLGDLITV